MGAAASACGRRAGDGCRPRHMNCPSTQRGEFCMSFAASPPENEDQRLGIAARMLGLLGLSTFLALTIWLLVQWPSLQPQLRMDWDPFWLKMHAAAILAVGILVWRAKGKVLLTLAAAVTLAVVATPMVNGATGWALPKLAILTALAVGLGQQGLKRLVPNAELAVGERLLLATVLGYGAISLLMFALGLLHCWRPAIVATVLWIAGLMVASDILDVFRQVRDEARDCWAPQWRSGDLRLAALAISLLCICGFGSYLFAVAPATHWDVLHYHLGIPRIYAERGELADLDHTWAVHCVRNGEMLYLLGLLIKGQPLPTLINFQFGLLAAGLVASLGALLSDRRTGLLAGCIFFALPLVSYVLATGMIDLILTAYVIAATYAFFRWKREGDAQWISLFSLFAGLAAGTKLNGLLLLGPFAAFLLADALYLGPDRRARLTNVARMIVPGLCALAPWLALTWIRTGNPVFPYLNKVFRSAAWYQQSNNGSSDWPGFGLGKTWFHALRLPWDMTFHGERFCEFGWYGTAGILLLGLPFGYFLVSKQQRRAMLELSAAILVWLAAFLKVAQYSRYMLPVFAFSAIVAALNCQIAWRVAARIPRVRWISLSLCVIGGCGWVFFTRTASIAELWLCHPERYPWRVALRVQRPDEYLHAALQGYEFMSFID
ncbi:MAG TPA: glycosyltransferase family 39 protein, partial [Pirellulales bacterium]|nr:glycosyltransferase family 39 protein [Pirellulales bacterium]